MRRRFVNGTGQRPRREGRGSRARQVVILAALGAWLAWAVSQEVVHSATGGHATGGAAMGAGAAGSAARTGGSMARGMALPAGLRPMLARVLRPGPGAPSGTTGRLTKLVAPGAAHSFGESVALSGSTAVIGAPGDPSTNNATGAAYVFVHSGSTWRQQATLTATGGAPNDNFGVCVALNGSTAIIGAPYKNNGTGAVYVFVRSGTTWRQQATLTAADGISGDWFGYAVALSGNTTLIGAYDKNHGTGAVYVFAQSGSTWSQQATLTATDGKRGDVFGGSIALSGNTAVIGAYGKHKLTGAAYVFGRSGTTWRQQATLTATDGVQAAYFGTVALSGNTAVIGARNQYGQTGAVYAFVHIGTSWLQQAKLTAAAGAPHDDLGFSVALSGNTAVIGAPGNYTINDDPGAAYVFVRSGATWSQRAKLTAADGA